MQCDLRKGGLGDIPYWRCPNEATVFFWNIDKLGGVCAAHYDADLEGILEVQRLYVPFKYADEYRQQRA